MPTLQGRQPGALECLFSVLPEGHDQREASLVPLWAVSTIQPHGTFSQNSLAADMASSHVFMTQVFWIPCVRDHVNLPLWLLWGLNLSSASSEGLSLSPSIIVLTHSKSITSGSCHINVSSPDPTSQGAFGV